MPWFIVTHVFFSSTLLSIPLIQRRGHMRLPPFWLSFTRDWLNQPQQRWPFAESIDTRYKQPDRQTHGCAYSTTASRSVAQGSRSRIELHHAAVGENLFEILSGKLTKQRVYPDHSFKACVYVNIYKHGCVRV